MVLEQKYKAACKGRFQVAKPMCHLPMARGWQKWRMRDGTSEGERSRSKETMWLERDKDVPLQCGWSLMFLMSPLAHCMPPSCPQKSCPDHSSLLPHSTEVKLQDSHLRRPRESRSQSRHSTYSTMLGELKAMRTALWFADPQSQQVLQPGQPIALLHGTESASDCPASHASAAHPPQPAGTTHIPRPLGQ